MLQKTINIKVIPRSSLRRIEEDLVGNLKDKVKSPPVGGQDNQEVINLLAKYYSVSKGNIEIINGKTSKNKVIRITK